MDKKIKILFKKILPVFIKKRLISIHYNYQIKLTPLRHKKALKKVRKKRKNKSCIFYNQ